MSRTAYRPSNLDESPSPATVSAFYAIVLYFSFSAVLCVQRFVILAGQGISSSGIFSPPFSLPFILGEELVFGVLFGVIVYIAWSRRLLRAMAVIAFGAYLCFLAIEAMAFKYFFTHVDYALYAESHDIKGMSSSIFASMDAAFFLDVLLAMCCAVMLAIPYRPRPIRWLTALWARRRLLVAGAAAAYVGITIILVASAEQYGLDRPFPIAFTVSYIEARAETARMEEAASRTPQKVHQPAAIVAPLEPSLDEMNPVRKAIAAYSGRLNVVLYLMESTSYHETSLDPASRFDTTPFLKRLAADSLLFQNYYTGVASSARALFSVMTGLHPFLDRKSDMLQYSALNVPNAVDILHDQGYLTAFFTSANTRFDSVDTYLLNRKYDTLMDENSVPSRERRETSEDYWGIDEEIMTDKALAWIESIRSKKKPFFVQYNAIFPHHPYAVPKAHHRFQKMNWGPSGSTHAQYRACLRYADASLERFVTGLDKMGILENTLLIVLPDHGEAFGDRHTANFIHANFCYDDDMHTLLLLHNKKALGPGKISARLASHVDILPTMLDILSAGKNFDIDGQSLISTRFRDPKVFCYSRRHLSVRDERFKFIKERDRRKNELYDMIKDPEEKSDLSSAMPEKVTAYREVLETWQTDVVSAYRERMEAVHLTAADVARLAQKNREAKQSKEP